MGYKYISDDYGEIVGKIYDDGEYTDKYGNVIGKVYSDGEVWDKYGEKVGKVYDDGTFTDKYGNIIGKSNMAADMADGIKNASEADSADSYNREEKRSVGLGDAFGAAAGVAGAAAEAGDGAGCIITIVLILVCLALLYTAIVKIPMFLSQPQLLIVMLVAVILTIIYGGRKLSKGQLTGTFKENVKQLLGYAVLFYFAGAVVLGIVEAVIDGGIGALFAILFICFMALFAYAIICIPAILVFAYIAQKRSQGSAKKASTKKVPKRKKARK